LGLLLVAVAAAITGCGGGAADTIRVSGSAEYEGQPITSGDIRFIPESRNTGSVVGGQIVDGSYSLDGKQSLRHGSYRVELKAYRNADGSPGAVNRKDPEANYVQYLPAKYNTNTELRFTLDANSPAEVKHDLSLAK